MPRSPRLPAYPLTVADHTITAPRRVELVDCESGLVVLDLPSDLQARIVAAASDAGMGVAEWMELVLSERGRA